MKKLIVGTIAVTVLSVGLFAMGSKGYQKGMMGEHRGGFIKPIMKELNLSGEQMVKIRDIIRDSRKDIQSPSDAFSQDGFDKVKFIKIIKSKRDRMIEKKADNMEKIYGILTDEQKSQFLKIIEDRKGKKGIK